MLAMECSRQLRRLVLQGNIQDFLIDGNNELDMRLVGWLTSNFLSVIYMYSRILICTTKIGMNYFMGLYDYHQ